MTNIKWRVTLREGRIDKYEKKTLLEWRMYDDGKHVLISDNLQPSSENEKELVKYLAKKNDMECENDYAFFFNIKENIRITDFQEFIEMMFRTMNQFHEDKKTQELLSFRIPQWIKEQVKEIRGNDVNYSEVVKDALVLWCNDKTKKKEGNNKKEVVQ